METKTEILICECNSPEHQLIVQYGEYDGETEIYFHIHLNKRPFWQRLIYGVKYIFGYQTRYGAFDEFILDKRDSAKIERILSHLKNENKTV